MADVVGSAAVTVEPDLSNFGAQLQAALGPALAEAVAAVNDATAQMASEAGGNAQALGAAIEDAVAPAVGEAASAVADASADMGAAFEGVADDATGMAAGIEGASAEAASALVDVGLAGDDMAAEIDAAAGEAASTLETAIGPAAEAAAAEVGGASTEMASALADVGAAATETGAEVEDAGGSFQSLQSEGTTAVTSMADMIKAVALGSLIADGIQGGVDIALESIQNLVTAIPSIGESFHRAFQQIRVGTGATGAELAGMEQSMRDVYAQTPAGMGEVANALQLLSQRLGVTGDDAEGVALSMIKLARITGSDVNKTVDSATAIFNNFGIAADDQTNQLDKFLRVAQETGVPVEQLLSSIEASGLGFKAAGFSIDETAAIIGNLSKVGLDASAVQLALGRATAKAAKDGIPAREAFDAIFDSIKNAPDQMSATATAVESFGQRAGPRLAELIRTGKLSYEELTASIQAGGDTIQQAAKDTGTWRGALAVLGHQIENALQPIATAVFGGMNTALRALIPIFGGLATVVGSHIVPVFNSLVEVGRPLWAVLDNIRDAFSKAVEALKLGADPLTAIQVFFNNIFDDAERGQQVADAIRAIGDAFGKLWDFLAPVRQAISDVFSTIGDGIKTFVDANPEAVIAGVGVVLAGLGGTAILAGLSALAGLLGTILGFLAPIAAGALAAAAPFIALGAAVVALVAGFKYLYENFDWFREGVDAVVDVVQNGLLVAFEDVSSWVQTNLLPVLETLGSRLSALWDALSGFDFNDILGSLSELGTALGGVLASLAADLPNQMLILAQTLMNELLTALRGLPIVGELIGVFQQWFNLAVGALGNIFDFLGGFLTLDTGRMATAASTLMSTIWMAIRDAIPATLAAVSNLGDFVGMLLDKLVEAVAGIPIVGPLVNAIRDLIVGAFEAVGNIGDLLSGIFHFDGAAIVSSLGDLGRTVADALLGVLGDLPTLIADGLSLLAGALGTVFGEWLPKAITGASDLLREGLRVAFQFLKDLPSIVGNLLVTYGPDVAKAIIGGIIGALKFAVLDLPKWIVTEAIPTLVSAIIDNAPKVLSALGDLAGKLPGLLGSVLGNLGGIIKDILFGLGDVFLTWGSQLGSLLVTLFTSAWDWLVQNGPTILANVGTWLAGLPGMILGWLGDLGSTLLGWLVGAFDWLVSNAISGMGRLISFFLSDLPLAIAGWLGDIGPKLFDWLKAGWDWLVDNGPTILARVTDWLLGLPGTIIGWLGNIGTLLTDWLKAGWGWLVDNGPTILAKINEWILSLPGKFLGLLGNIGTLLVDWLKAGFQWVVDNGPTIIQGVIDFFSGLPGKIFDAIKNGLSSAGGAVTDLAKSLYNAIAGFVNDHLLNPVRTFKVSVLGRDFTPFKGIPQMPLLAKGAIVDEPTAAIIGEAGREAAVPLDDEAAGVRVAEQAGIPGMLARAGALGPGGTSLEVYVTVEPPAGADEGWARQIGRSVGEAAADAATRKLRLEAAIRAS